MQRSRALYITAVHCKQDAKARPPAMKLSLVVRSEATWPPLRWPHFARNEQGKYFSDGYESIIKDPKKAQLRASIGNTFNQSRNVHADVGAIAIGLIGPAACIDSRSFTTIPFEKNDSFTCMPPPCNNSSMRGKWCASGSVEDFIGVDGRISLFEADRRFRGIAEMGWSSWVASCLSRFPIDAIWIFHTFLPFAL